MFDFNSFKEYIEFEKDLFNDDNEKIRNFCQSFIEATDNIEFKDFAFFNFKEENLVKLEINAFFIIKEIIDNIFLKNITAIYSGCRTLMEDIIIMKYLKMNDKYINEMFNDYEKTKFIVIEDKELIKKFSKKYKLSINNNRNDQWIDIANKYNNYKGKRGFASILEQVISKDEEYKIIYKIFCNFIHISEGSFFIKCNMHLEKEKTYNIFIYKIVDFLILELRILIFESLEILDEESKSNKKLYEIIRKLELI